MPNTLGHIGVQGLLTRKLFPAVDLKWVYLGCVIPDIPWIGQRLLRLLPTVDRLDLRLYAVVQASLVLCLLLSLALALPARRSGRCFTVLALGCGMHLLLDAAQRKWANGVNLLAPLDWQLLNYGQFWPEQWPTWVLTAMGMAYLLWHWREAFRTPLDLHPPSWRRWGAAALLLLAYGLLPLALLQGPGSADSHFVTTLREVASRPGRYLEVDRGRYHPDAGGGMLEIFTGERLRLRGVDLRESAKISVRGRFITPDTLAVDTYQLHGKQRDPFSLIGLMAVACLWAVGLWRAWWGPRWPAVPGELRS